MSPVSHVKLPLNFSLDWCWNLGSRIRWMICRGQRSRGQRSLQLSTLSVGCLSIQGVTPARCRRMVFTTLSSVAAQSTLCLRRLNRYSCCTAWPQLSRLQPIGGQYGGGGL